MPKKKAINGKPEVHSELKGFDIKINEFGEITSNLEVDLLNVFLNENVIDKKFKDRIVK
ncbi:MAG: hypothetical protein AB8G86_21850 [Saprospiraceae bacterium]